MRRRNRPEFFGSMTSLRPELLGPGQTWRVLAALGLDPNGFDDSTDHLLILRHTLMNPYLIDHENGISYIDRYFDFLERRVPVVAAQANIPARSGP